MTMIPVVPPFKGVKSGAASSSSLSRVCTKDSWYPRRFDGDSLSSPSITEVLFQASCEGPSLSTQCDQCELTEFSHGSPANLNLNFRTKKDLATSLRQRCFFNENYLWQNVHGHPHPQWRRYKVAPSPRDPAGYSSPGLCKNGG